jgi:hypothetical protein
MKKIQRPTHRLAVRSDKIKMIQAIAMSAVERPGHDAMHGQRADSATPAIPGALQDFADGELIVHGTDTNAEYIPRATVDHACSARQRSTFFS